MYNKLSAPRICLRDHVKAHPSIGKAANVVGLGENYRIIPANRADDYAVDVDALAVEMAADRAQGLLPTVVVADVGSTSSGAIDPVRAMGEVCQRYKSRARVSRIDACL